ncbi:M15 family metallopeptidase [Crocosphaera sp. Alani8]|uniref:M15 family metallopeptidase n=1 Tax=Crocosphaera sp. Alani8 TaxID=3038952 RepID=UPI00313E555B
MKDKQQKRPLEDIPEALRDIPISPRSSSLNPKWIMLGLAGVAILTLGTLGVVRLFSSPSPTNTVSVEPTPSPSPTPEPEKIENILGHLPYEEANPTQLKAITGDGRIKLRNKAADSFLQMQRDARASGIVLTAISGFRTVEQQEYLFFEIKRQRNQDTRKRAQVSAPPKYSEHHTGYAIDIGDGQVPATNLSENFEQTPAFRWLESNAAKYSFELSFPRNNPQGISYEPWHWRYVGDAESLKTFYEAQQLQNTSSSEENTVN